MMRRLHSPPMIPSPAGTGETMERPLSYPPQGVIPNFANPPFMGTPVLATAGICIPLVLIFAGLRIYAKGFILKKWKFDDFIYFISCPVGLAMISFEVSLIISGANGYHAWDMTTAQMTKSSIVQILIFSIALGPVLWLLKLTLFCLIAHAFGSIRWLKNCVYIGIILTGLLYAAYTIIFAVSCGPTPDTNTTSYLAGLAREQCSSPSGLNAIASIAMGAMNFISDVYLLILPLPIVRTLTLPTREKVGVYVILLSGLLMCICSLLGLVFRVQYWKAHDFTGGQIRIYVVFLAEIAVGLMIPCMPSVATVYRHWRTPKITDTDDFANMRGFSIISSPPGRDSRSTWQKTHPSVEDIHYSRPSTEMQRHTCDGHLMKALPSTPFPVHHQPQSADPLSPSSVRSMTLPIMLFHI